MKTNRLTQGPIFKGLIKYFLPIFLGSLIQQSYSIVDAIIVGRYAGVYALASIDATYNFTKLIIQIFISISLGGAIIIAQQYGAKAYKKLSQSSHVLIAMALLGGLVLTILGLILTPAFIGIMKVPDDLVEMSKAYLSIYFLGTSALFLYNIGAGILRALGDSKRPFYVLLLSSILNILLDVIFISYLGMGIAGAGLATVISQVLASVIILVMLLNHELIRLRLPRLSLKLKILWPILKIGVPMGLQTSFYIIANMFMQRAINSFGALEVAGWAVVGKLDFIVWLIIDAVAITATTYVAQNLGAKKNKRIGQGIKLLLVFSMLIVGGFSLILYFYSGSLTILLTSDQAVISMTKYMMRIIAPFYFVTSISSLTTAYLKAYGHTFFPMVITLICTCLIRLLWVTIINESIRQVLLAYPMTWLITLVAILLYTYTFRKNKSKLTQAA